MIPAPSARAPIGEAVAELTFVPSRAWTGAIADEVAAALRVEYPGEPKRRGHIHIAVGPSGSAAAPLVQKGVLLPSTDGKALVGVGENVLSVHVLSPYPGWVNFRPRIQRAIETFARLT